MIGFHVSAEDALTLIRAVDALRRMHPPAHLDAKLSQLQSRIRARLPGFTLGELQNLRLGLEALLAENPMDWKAERLLRTLRSASGLPPGHTSD